MTFRTERNWKQTLRPDANSGSGFFPSPVGQKVSDAGSETEAALARFIQ